MKTSKIKLDPDEIQEHMRNNYQLYASQSVRGKQLRFFINQLIEYRVIYGKSIIYEGVEMSEAIKAWDFA